MGSKSAAAQGSTAGRTANPAAFTLVHFVSGTRTPMFSPTRLMNPVSYIGRTPQNDVVLGSDNVSRRHAKIIVTDMGVTVHDLDSHNGVFLNGKKVRSAPVNVGDLLYVADVCLELRRSPDADLLGNGLPASDSRIQSNDITGEEDPDTRSLAAMLRASEILARGDEDVIARQILEVCRELVEANVAVLVQLVDGVMTTPVVVQPETGKPSSGAPVIWSVVQKAFDEALPLLSEDLKRDPIATLATPDAKDEATMNAAGAVMVIPVVLTAGGDGDPVEEAMYLSRPTPGQMFTARELTTLSAIAQMLALRRGPTMAHAEPAIEMHGDSVAVQAKVEAAEERLREAQDDVRALTERLHGLEADALKLKQQIEIEKQAAVDAKREAERGRSEANKLEQGLHKTDEDAKRLKDALLRSEEERNKLKENYRAADDDRKNRQQEIEKLRENLKTSEGERAAEQSALRGEIQDHVRAGQERDDALQRDVRVRDEEIERLNGLLAKLGDESKTTREGLEKAVSDQLAASETLKIAMRATVPPGMAEHIEAAANEERELVTEAHVRPVAALYITLRGFDSWATTAAPDDIKRRLDHFCNSVALRARANGGRVEQVLGHAHLLTFGADAAAVRDAVRCGLEVAALVPDEPGGASGPVGVASGLHVGPSASGYFGEGDTATHVEAGEAILVARGIASLAHDSSFFVTKAVQQLVSGDPAFVLGMMGPAALVGGPTVSLYRVMPAAFIEVDDDVDGGRT